MSWDVTPYLKPYPAQGVYFHRRSIQSYIRVPKGCFGYGITYIPTDTSKPGQEICHLVVEIDMERTVYIADCYVGSISTREAVDWLMMLHEGAHRVTVEATPLPRRDNIYGVRTWFVDPMNYTLIDEIVSGKIRDMIKKDETRPKNLNVTALPAPLDLFAMAKSAQGEMVAGRIKVPERSQWRTGFMAEICQWPTVRSDSRVRALAILAAAIPDMTAPARAGITRKAGSQWTA